MAGDRVSFSWTAIIVAGFTIISIFISANYSRTETNAADIQKTNAVLQDKVSRQELKECKIDLAVNQANMESRIMARLDKLDATLERHTAESIEELRKRVIK